MGFFFPGLPLVQGMISIDIDDGFKIK